MFKCRTIIEHKIFNKLTILSGIVLPIISVLFIELCGSIIIDSPVSFFSANFIYGYGSVVFSFVALLFFKNLFFPEFSGTLQNGDFKTGAKLSLIFPVYFLISTFSIFIYSYIYSHSTKLNINLDLKKLILYTGMSLMAGFAEETSFRGILCSYLMRQYKNSSKKIPFVMLFSSIFFGLIHLTNLTFGRTSYVLLQSFSAVFLGFFLCALYLRSGILWFPILIHFANDLLAFILSSEELQLDPTAFAQTSIDFSSIIDSFFCVVLGLVGWYLVRKENYSKIDKIWSKKWQPISPKNIICNFQQEQKKDSKKVAKLLKKSSFSIKEIRNSEQYIPELSFILKSGKKIISHVTFVKTLITKEDDTKTPAIKLASFYTRPYFQHKGFGKLLLNYAINEAKSKGFDTIIINEDNKCLDSVMENNSIAE